MNSVYWSVKHNTCFLLSSDRGLRKKLNIFKNIVISSVNHYIMNSVFRYSLTDLNLDIKKTDAIYAVKKIMKMSP